MVLDHDTDAAIQRATIRATARNIQVQYIGSLVHGYERTEIYLADSASREELSHSVFLHYSAEGIDAECGCEAGQRGLVCHHIAAALRAEEMPQAEPDLNEQITALAERLRRYWMTEVGNWTEYDRLHAQLRELRSRVRPTPVAEPWRDPNFITNLLTPPAGY